MVRPGKNPWTRSGDPVDLVRCHLGSWPNLFDLKQPSKYVTLPSKRNIFASIRHPLHTNGGRDHIFFAVETAEEAASRPCIRPDLPAKKPRVGRPRKHQQQPCSCSCKPATIHFLSSNRSVSMTVSLRVKLFAGTYN